LILSLKTKSAESPCLRIVRELLENYIKDRDIGSYIDDLWMRTGTKLKAQGVTLKDLDSAIKDVRAKQ
jgi:hypothetical protein